MIYLLHSTAKAYLKKRALLAHKNKKQTYLHNKLSGLFHACNYSHTLQTKNETYVDLLNNTRYLPLLHHVSTLKKAATKS